MSRQHGRSVRISTERLVLLTSWIIALIVRPSYGVRSTTPSVAVMIAVVDDDAFVRDALEDLITSFGHRVRTFHSADDFVQSGAICVLSSCCLGTQRLKAPSVTS